MLHVKDDYLLLGIDLNFTFDAFVLQYHHLIFTFEQISPSRLRKLCRLTNAEHAGRGILLYFVGVGVNKRQVPVVPPARPVSDETYPHRDDCC